MNIAVPEEIKEKGDEACFLWETIYDTEHFKPEADMTVDHIGEKLEEVYFPIHLSKSQSSFTAIWETYARFGQLETKETPQSLKMHSNSNYRLFGIGGDYIDPKNYNDTLAIISNSTSLAYELKEKRIGRRFILGNPGSGKSMLCSRVALACARSDFGIKKFAVLLKCRNIENHYRRSFTLTYKSDDSLEEFELMAYEMSSTYLKLDNFSALLNRHAEKGDLLIIIDGFDELSNDNKKLLTRSLHNYLNKEENSQVDVIITGRIYNYSHEEMQYVDGVFLYHYIMRLTQQEKEYFVKQWLKNQSGLKQVNMNFVNEVLGELKDNVENIIENLSGIPLFLSRLLEIKANSGYIPINMATYNNHFLRQIFDRRTHDSIPYKRIGEFIAYKMSLGSVDMKIVISRSEIISYIVDYYETNKQQFRHRIDKREAENILNVMEGVMALFVPAISHRGKMWGLQFIHLSVQELLCAKAINEHVVGNGAVEFLKKYSVMGEYLAASGTSLNPLSNIKHNNYKSGILAIAQDLITICNSNEQAENENEEIERILIEQRFDQLLEYKVKEGMKLFYPKRVLEIIINSDIYSGQSDYKIEHDAWSIVATVKPEYRTTLKEVADEHIFKAKNRISFYETIKEMIVFLETFDIHTFSYQELQEYRYYKYDPIFYKTIRPLKTCPISYRKYKGSFNDLLSLDMILVNKYYPEQYFYYKNELSDLGSCYPSKRYDRLIYSLNVLKKIYSKNDV